MKLDITIDCVQVGHGDCTIITVGKGSPWTCIIDAGKGTEEANKNIHDLIKRRNINKFDLAVLSHFDHDHMGGFDELIKSVRIDRYWSPYTPAIEKCGWLFGDRGAKAVTKAKEIEKQLFSKEIFLESPTEGYVHSPIDGLRIKVFSPPVKLYEALFTERRKLTTVQNFDDLIGDLVSGEYDDTHDEQSPDVHSMYKRMYDGSIHRDLEEEARVTERTVSKHGVVPDFMGNSAINNTSLVLKIEVWTGCQWYSLLFPGDLENWLYLLARRHESIKADFYKVSHHGSKVYIKSNEDATHEVMQAIRPSIALISGNGEHGLPNASTRNTLEQWSATVFCTQDKQNEQFRINGEKIVFDEKSCKKNHNCTQTKNAVTFSMKDGVIEVNKQACVTNTGRSIYPVIQMQQHMIPDSKVLYNLSEAEIQKHTKWLLKKLKEIHEDRCKDVVLSSSELISADIIHAKAVADKRDLTERQIERIFEYGYNKNKWWLVETDHYSRDKMIYQKASIYELNKMAAFAQKYDVLITPIPAISKGLEAILLQMPAKRLFELIEEKFAYPYEIIKRFCWPIILKKISALYSYAWIDVHRQYKYNSRYEQPLLLIMYKKSMFECLDEALCTNIDKEGENRKLAPAVMRGDKTLLVNLCKIDGAYKVSEVLDAIANGYSSYTKWSHGTWHK